MVGGEQKPLPSVDATLNSADLQGEGSPDGAVSAILERHFADRASELQMSVAAAKKEATHSLMVIVLLLVLSLLPVGGVFWLRAAEGWWVGPLQWLLWGFAAFCWLFVIVGTVMYFNERSQQADLARELSSVQKRAGLVAPDLQTDYFEQLVAINLSNLSDYYALVRSHAGRSFVLAATASILGFALICGALGFALNVKDAQSVGYAGTAAGIVTEMVSAVFFVLYSKTVRQLKEYHDSLIHVQNVLLSLKMVESIEDPAVRATLTADVLRSLLAGQSSNAASGATSATP